MQYKIRVTELVLARENRPSRDAQCNTEESPYNDKLSLCSRDHHAVFNWTKRFTTIIFYQTLFVDLSSGNHFVFDCHSFFFLPDLPARFVAEQQQDSGWKWICCKPKMTPQWLRNSWNEQSASVFKLFQRGQKYRRANRRIGPILNLLSSYGVLYKR